MFISNRNKKILMFLTMFFYPFLPIIKEWSSLYGTLLEVILLIGLFCISVIRMKKGKIVVLFNKYVAALVILLVIYFVMNMNDLSVAISGLRALLLYIFFYLIENDTRFGQAEIIKITCYGCFITTMIMSIGCVIQFIYPSLIRSSHNPAAWDSLRTKTDWTPLGIYNRAISFMVDPNVLSVYLFFSFVLMVIFWKKKKEKKFLLMMSISVIGLVLTQSRTGIFLFIIYIVSSLVVGQIRNKHVSIKRLIIISGIGVLVICVVINNWDNILTFLRVDTLMNGNGRVEKNAMQIETFFTNTLKLILGNGLFDGREIIFENSYLMILYMFGIIGTIFWVLLSSIVFKNIFCAANIEILLCYGAAIFVGDYILIPQITLVAILCLISNICDLS